MGKSTFDQSAEQRSSLGRPRANESLGGEEDPNASRLGPDSEAPVTLQRPDPGRSRRRRTLRSLRRRRSSKHA